MFDFAWSELALIAVVALIAIGPKDMPGAIRGVTEMIKKARRMASEFQTHVDEMVRDADLHEIRNQISEIRNFDVRGQIEKAVDPDGSLRSTFAGNPLDTTPSIVTPPPVEERAVSELAVVDPPVEYPGPALEGSTGAELAAPPEPEPAAPLAPAFIPPNMVAPPEPKVADDEPPAFIPPDVVLERRSHQSVRR